MTRLFFLILELFLAFQFEGDDPAPFDKLETTGFLGRWEISEINNKYVAHNWIEKPFLSAEMKGLYRQVIEKRFDQLNL
jgi:hypothetical protein